MKGTSSFEPESENEGYLFIGIFITDMTSLTAASSVTPALQREDWGASHRQGGGTTEMLFIFLNTKTTQTLY